MQACVGFSTHSGWAVAVTCGLDGAGHLTVLDRRRAQLISDDLPRQPYHAVADMTAEDAEATVARVAESIDARSRVLLGELVASAGDASVSSVAVVGRPREIPDVATVLASHARMHASEGELYRQGVVDAADALGLLPHRFAPEDLPFGAAEAAGWDAARFEVEWKRVRQTIGPPWGKDHKLAAMAALVALAS